VDDVLYLTDIRKTAVVLPNVPAGTYDSVAYPITITLLVGEETFVYYHTHDDTYRYNLILKESELC
jgi:hypothetical protein